MSSHGEFPFGRLDQENRETPEVRHLRDNSRYLLQNGLPSVITAVAIYLRGIMMNMLVMLPLLLCAAGFLLWLNPDTKELVTNRFLWLDLTGLFGQTRLPFTILTLLLLTGLLIFYAVLVSVFPIKPIGDRQKAANIRRRDIRTGVAGGISRSPCSVASARVRIAGSDQSPRTPPIRARANFSSLYSTKPRRSCCMSARSSCWFFRSSKA